MFIHYGFPSCHRETAYLRLQRQREASLLQPTPFVNSVYRLDVRACNEPYGARRRVSRSLAITLKHPLTSTRTIVLLINLADIEGNILLSRKSNNFFFSPRSPSQKAGTCHIHQCPFHRHYLEDHHAIYRSHNS